MSGNAQLAIDFTKPDEGKAKAIWNREELIACTEDGFGWDGRPNESCDVWIQTREPIAVGWSWRATYAVNVSAEIVPPGQFKVENGMTTYPAGQIYARYSPDAKNWSSWSALRMDAPKDPANAKQIYSGELRAPTKEREPYLALLDEYRKRDVPWKSDEEAAVKWILERDPQYFQKIIPFIGYVEFMYESSLAGGHRIREVHFDISFGAGGLASTPRDAAAAVDRNGPWRYRAKDE